MNLDSMPRPETIHVSAPASLSRPSLLNTSQTMPQRSPFAIQELLGLSGSGSAGSASANPPSGSSGNGNGNNTSSSAEHSLHSQQQQQQQQHQHQQQQRNNGGSAGGSGGIGNGSGSGSANSVATAVTPASLYPNVGQTPFSSDHHQMTMAASRMAYFNAHAAVAAAFLPHNMGGGGGHLGFHGQNNGE